LKLIGGLVQTGGFGRRLWSSHLLLLLLVAPAIIMPLFNKFTPRRERCATPLALAQRTGLPTRSIDVMDGGKRLAPLQRLLHGVRRFRKIALLTLIF
jgi:hypothetical protein